MKKHELFEELEAFDPNWQTRFDTLRQAAREAGVMDIYRAYMASMGGRRDAIDNVPDTLNTIRQLQGLVERDKLRYGGHDFGRGEEFKDNEDLSDVPGIPDEQDGPLGQDHETLQQEPEPSYLMEWDEV